jgi:hypothetical protein
MLLDGVKCSELAKLGGVISRRSLSLRPNILPATQTKISSERTLDRLLEWGPTYLGKAATADVYIKAVGLVDAEKSGASMTNGKEITVRARVLPRASKRKPFLLQRRFNLDEM